MNVYLSKDVLREIEAHGEAAYPEEGAGLLLGSANGGRREVTGILPLENAREGTTRRNRYLIAPEDMMKAEDRADQMGLAILGVFHSHPDHPSRPSAFDREWALPWFSYLITSVRDGRAEESRCWRLADDRGKFTEEEIEIYE